MPVCLHCGEIGDDGALFCGKCGYTLPQGAPAPVAVAPPGPRAAPGVAPTVPTPPSLGSTAPAGTYVTVVAPGTNLQGPIPPPPNAKYCARCRTPIAVAAVYCPVCQQPQP